MSGLVHRASTFATQPRTACAGQLIDGEVVARAEPAIADGELGSRGRGPNGMKRSDSGTLLAQGERTCFIVTKISKTSTFEAIK
jgi:hypothetical protein